MDYTTAISSYNNKVQALIGESIRSIDYCEIDFGEPLFDCDTHHSVDHGIQFEMESGNQFYAMWSEQYQSHDLKFGTGSILTQFPTAYPPPMRNLTHHNKWQPLIGKKISQAISNWPFVHYQNKKSSLRYPQDLFLQFGEGISLVISAVEINDSTTVQMTNNITVFFNLAIANEHGIFKNDYTP